MGKQILCGPKVTTQPLFCTSRELDACKGDSGGPLFLFDSIDMKFIMVGLVQGSISYECGDMYLKGMYTRIDSPEIINFIYPKRFQTNTLLNGKSMNSSMMVLMLFGGETNEDYKNSESTKIIDLANPSSNCKLKIASDMSFRRHKRTFFRYGAFITLFMNSYPMICGGHI